MKPGSKPPLPGADINRWESLLLAMKRTSLPEGVTVFDLSSVRGASEDWGTAGLPSPEGERAKAVSETCSALLIDRGF
jgi:hypothetical protein